MKQARLWPEMIIAFIAIAMLLTLGFALGMRAGEKWTHERATEHGAGQYNAVTGEFQWVERDEQGTDQDRN